MKKIFYKSKSKIMSLIFTEIIILIVGILILVLLVKPNRTSAILSLSGCSVMGIIVIKSSITLFRDRLEIGDKIVLTRIPLSWQVKFEDIKRIDYQGIRFLPIFDVMIIKSDTDFVSIDYNFPHYLDIWKQVLELSLEKNPEIQVDIRLLKKLKLQIKK